MGYLSDIARRRIAAVLLVLGGLLAVLAIADAGPFSDPPTEEERVHDAVQALFAAGADADFAAYCDRLTETARETVRTSAARLVPEAQELECPEILVEAAGDSLEGIELRVTEVSVSGNRARVEAALRSPEGGGPQPRTILLELGDDDEWLVSDPGA